MEESTEMMEVEVEEMNTHSSANPIKLKNFIQTNFGNDYVFQIVPKDDWTQMAVSLSTNAVKIYAPETGQYMGECKGHSGTVNHISFSGSLDPNLLHSCSSDGTLRAWDTRTFHQVLVVNAPSQEIFSFSYGGSTNNLLAAGCKSQILLWDWRTKKQVASLDESHTEDVTQVHFVPDNSNMFASASVDGLICIFDANGEISEDNNLDTVINVGTSIGKIGFFGESSQKLWCLTLIETLSIWDWKDSRNEVNLQDARSLASDSWSLDHVDYFVDCHHSGESLWVIGGTNTGSLGYFPVDFKGAGKLRSPEAILSSGHVGVVRSALRMPALRNQSIFGWTGGEDSRLCCWFSDDSLSNTSQSWASSAKPPRISKRARSSTPY